jgi:hypothetical protein
MAVLVNKSVLQNLEIGKRFIEEHSRHYEDFEGSLIEFLALDHISKFNKIWVSLKLLPEDLLEAFTSECVPFVKTCYSISYNSFERAHASSCESYAKSRYNELELDRQLRVIVNLLKTN